MSSLAEIRDKPSQPLGLAYPDILKTWSAKLDTWTYSMKRLCKLNVERTVVFRRNKLPIRLLTKLIRLTG